MLPIAGISISIFTLIFFMLRKIPSSMESIAYALMPIAVNSLVSFIAIGFYIKKKTFDLKRELKDIKWLIGTMVLSLAMFIAIYLKFF